MPDPSIPASVPSLTERLQQIGRRDSRNSDYLQNYNLRKEDIPELIALCATHDLTDPSRPEPEVWGSVHAWRALGLLRAEAAVDTLIGLLWQIEGRDDDRIGEELPGVFGMIGPAAIEPLAAYLADRSKSEFARVGARGGMVKVALNFPECRDRVVGILTEALATYSEDDDIVNGFLVSGLLDLKGIESARVLEEAHRRRCVDESICGDWEDVQEELGLQPRKVMLNARQRNILGRAIDGVLPRDGTRNA